MLTEIIKGLTRDNMVHIYVDISYGGRIDMKLGRDNKHLNITHATIPSFSFFNKGDRDYRNVPIDLVLAIVGKMKILSYRYEEEA